MKRVIDIIRSLGVYKETVLLYDLLKGFVAVFLAIKCWFAGIEVLDLPVDFEYKGFTLKDVKISYFLYLVVVANSFHRYIFRSGDKDASHAKSKKTSSKIILA